MWLRRHSDPLLNRRPRLSVDGLCRHGVNAVAHSRWSSVEAAAFRLKPEATSPAPAPSTEHPHPERSTQHAAPSTERRLSRRYFCGTTVVRLETGEKQEHLLHVRGAAANPELVILARELQIDEWRPHRLQAATDRVEPPAITIESFAPCMSSVGMPRTAPRCPARCRQRLRAGPSAQMSLYSAPR